MWYQELSLNDGDKLQIGKLLAPLLLLITSLSSTQRYLSARESFLDPAIQRFAKDPSFEVYVFWIQLNPSEFFGEISIKKEMYSIASKVIALPRSSRTHKKGLVGYKNFHAMGGPGLRDLNWVLKNVRGKKLFIIDLPALLIETQLTISWIELISQYRVKDTFIFKGFDSIEKKFPSYFLDIKESLEVFLEYYLREHHFEYVNLKDGERALICSQDL